MIYIAICEDEAECRRILQEYLREYAKSRNCIVEVDEFSNGYDILNSEREYQIAFLDVDMPGVNGIETGRRLWQRSKQCSTIYVTNLNQWREIAQNQVHSFAYLNKPIKKMELFEQLDDLLPMLRESESKNSAVNFNTIEYGLIRKSPDDIFYFEYAGRKMSIHCRNGIYHVKGNIGDMEEKMKEYNFVMPHKSFLVNLKYVSTIRQYEAVLLDGTAIPVAQKRRSIFRRTFTAYLQREGKP